MSTVVKRKSVSRYNRAVYNELKKMGKAPDDALRTFKNYYRPLQQTWGYELNPEAFADEMLNVQRMVERAKTSRLRNQPVMLYTSEHDHNAIIHAEISLDPDTTVKDL